MNSTELSKLIAPFGSDTVYIRSERPDGSRVFLPVTGVRTISNGIMLTTD